MISYEQHYDKCALVDVMYTYEPGCINPLTVMGHDRGPQ